MPKPRKPIAVLKNSGTTNAHPGRYQHRLAEPRPTSGVPEKPASFSDAESKLWDSLCAELMTMRVLSPHDGLALESLVREWVTYQRLATDGVTKPARHQCWSRVVRLLEQFGLSPKSRPYVAKVSPADSEDPFEELRRRRG